MGYTLPVPEILKNDMALYLDACLDEHPGDGSLVRTALDEAAIARGITQLARVLA